MTQTEAQTDSNKEMLQFRRSIKLYKLFCENCYTHFGWAVEKSSRFNYCVYCEKVSQ